MRGRAAIDFELQLDVIMAHSAVREGGDMAGEICIEVVGSTGNVYVVRCTRVSEQLVLTCECEAAVNGRLCKHRLALLEGDFTAARELATDVPARLATMAAGTPIMARVAEFRAAEVAADAASKLVKKLRLALGREMAGA